jgi:hypothetical protein
MLSKADGTDEKLNEVQNLFRGRVVRAVGARSYPGVASTCVRGRDY